MANCFYTNVICEYHDNEHCRCTQYSDRSLLVPDCIKVTPEVARTEKWLPDTCAYRLLAEDKPLFDWHPLISGERNSGIPRASLCAIKWLPNNMFTPMNCRNTWHIG